MPLNGAVIFADLIGKLDELTANYPKKMARNVSDQCGAHCPDLPKAM